MTYEDDRPIVIHKPEDFEGMRKAGKLAAEVLDMIGEFVVPGVATEELNERAHDMILAAGAIPAPLGYRGFPKSICTSVNHVVCHGIPGGLRLKEGDTVNIDVTVIVDGWHGDTSRMYFAGEPSIKYKRLCDVTFDAMWLGIEQVKPGKHIGDIGHAIEEYALKHGYSVVEDYCGHGLGKVFHTAPNVLHYGNPGEGPEIREGMFFTVEPMLNAGKHETILSRHDGWTVTTRDKSRSSQFEHSIGVTATGYEVFTLSPTKKDKPPYA